MIRKGGGIYSTVYRALRRFWSGGREMRQIAEELERTQWFSRQELEAWQLVRIQKLVKHAYEHVPYYHDLFQSRDIHPEDIKTLKDFRCLPFLTREDVVNHLDSLICPELRSEAQDRFTGGSTGQPMHFVVDQLFRRWDLALELRGRGWYGVAEGDKNALIWGNPQDFHARTWRARLKARILRERYLNAFSMTEADMRAFAEMLVRWQPDMFRAYASALSLFAEFIRRQGIEGVRPKLVELTAEKVLPSQRQLLEEVFQCKVADWYSSRELGTIAFQCPEGGLHVCETRLLEIIADGRVVEPGQLGEVVVTSLHQYTMPFIRYKLNDVAAYAPPHGACTCGRGLPVLQEVAGKTVDYVVTADGRFVHGTYFDSILSGKPEIARYQVYQPDEQHLEVRLVRRQEVNRAWLESLRHELQSLLGTAIDISFRLMDSIPLTSAGKHRLVISDVSRQGDGYVIFDR